MMCICLCLILYTQFTLYSWLNKYHFYGSAASYCFLISNDKSYNKRESRIFVHIKPVAFFQKSFPPGLNCSEYTCIHY